MLNISPFVSWKRHFLVLVFKNPGVLHRVISYNVRLRTLAITWSEWARGGKAGVFVIFHHKSPRHHRPLCVTLNVDTNIFSVVLLLPPECQNGGRKKHWNVGPSLQTGAQQP